MKKWQLIAVAVLSWAAGNLLALSVPDLGTKLLISLPFCVAGGLYAGYNWGDAE